MVTDNPIVNNILKHAEYGLSIQYKSGAMPEGINGPHNHKMTGARNTSHWIILFLHAYTLSNKQTFKDASLRALDFLLSPAILKTNQYFIHRKQKGFNEANGLIGQAWSLEALYYASRILETNEYKNIALSVFNNHKFDQYFNLWYRKEDNNTDILEGTVNQQIWFAAIGAKLQEDNDHTGLTNIKLFLDNIEKQFVVRNNIMVNYLLKDNLLYKVYDNIKLYKKYGFSNNVFSEIQLPYHIFALTGFAILYDKFKEHAFWKSKKFMRIISIILDPSIDSLLLKSRYGYTYNVSGFEIPFIIRTFKEIYDPNEISELGYVYLKKQFDVYNNREIEISDRITFEARYYEVCRLLGNKF